jgi:hypothetical protein
VEEKRRGRDEEWRSEGGTSGEGRKKWSGGGEEREQLKWSRRKGRKER